MGRCKDMTSVLYIQLCALHITWACFLLNHLTHLTVCYFVLSKKWNLGILENLSLCCLWTTARSKMPRNGTQSRGLCWHSLNPSVRGGGVNVRWVGIWNENITLTVKIVGSHGFFFEKSSMWLSVPKAEERSWPFDHALGALALLFLLFNYFLAKPPLYYTTSEWTRTHTILMRQIVSVFIFSKFSFLILDHCKLNILTVVQKNGILETNGLQKWKNMVSPHSPQS